MERTDIFKQILETEQKARESRAEAVQQQAGLEKFLAEKESEYRSASYAAAEAEITAEEKRFRESVDAELERLKVKQTRDVLNIHISFDKKLDEWVDKLFEIVVGNN